MTPTATETTSKETFDYYIGPLTIESKTRNYEQLRPASRGLMIAGVGQGDVVTLNTHEPIILSASEPAALPLHALIMGLQVVSGASASVHTAARLIEVAAGQIDGGDLTITPVIADNAPVGERIRENARATALVESRLNAFSELSEGWLDGQGEAPTPAALAIARHMIRVLLNLNLPRPRLAPTLEGGVEAEWSMGDREISVTFEPDGRLYGNSVDVSTGEVAEPTLDPHNYQAVADFVLGPGA